MATPLGWSAQLREAMERDEIPLFLADLQALVAALREERAWHGLFTARLRGHADLVLAYLTPGPARDAVAKALRA